MGWLDSPEENERKKRVAKMKDRIAKEGISNIVPEKDYQKILIEQNQTIIDLLVVNTIVSSGIAGDAVTIVHQDNYYKAIERVLNNN